MILIRLYGHNTEQMIDRDTEIRNMAQFDASGCGPTIYATWKNGVAYSFIPGDVITTETVTDPQINQLIIEMFVKMHKMPKAREGACLWDRLRQFLRASPENGFVGGDEDKAKRFKEAGIMSYEQLGKEIDDMEAALKDCGSPVVFTHNDLLLANIIYNKDEGKVTFIDYEYGDSNYLAFDLGNHFTEFVGVGDKLDYDGLYPKEDFQKEWLGRYLTAYNGSKPTEAEVHELYVLVNKFALTANLQWGIWALVQAKNSSLDFDFIDYAMQRLNEYKRRKEQFLALE